MDIIDTALIPAKNNVLLVNEQNRIRISGYIQPQFIVTNGKGSANYSDGDFAPNTNNRFMLRRGRIRFDYGYFNSKRQLVSEFYLQFDGTERGVFIRDFWGRYFENKWQLFSVTAGMFARPFGYELNLSSSDRESPERGRMSQILMRTERDMGVMISFNPRKKNHFFRFLKVDAGIFNGPGLQATTDFDSYKDFIARASIKPISIQKKLIITAGGSLFRGGFLQNTPVTFSYNNGRMQQDSTTAKIGSKIPRRYKGLDAQLKYLGKKSTTEIRTEFWWGTQSATDSTSETPFALLQTPTYIRRFAGGFIYCIQSIGNKHQILAKYDWYDPNVNVKGMEIGIPNGNFTAADIKYKTFGFGYIHHFNESLKLVLWYDRIINEATRLTHFTSDIKDDVFTCRWQFRF